MKRKYKEITFYPYKIENQQDYLFHVEDSKMSDIIIKCIKRLQKIVKKDRKWEIDSDNYAQLIEIKKVNNKYLLGFAKLSIKDGPAKGNMKGEVNSFHLKDDEGFLHMAVALYDPQNQAFIAQYSQQSISAEKMFSYIMEQSTSDAALAFRLCPIIRSDIMNQVNSSTNIRQFNVKVYVPGLSEEDYQQNIALYDVLSRSGFKDFNGEITFTFKPAKGSTVTKPIRTLINNAKDIIALLSPHRFTPITKCNVTIKNDDDKNEFLDLINARINATEKVQINSDRIVPFTYLFEAVTRVYSTWKNTIY